MTFQEIYTIAAQSIFTLSILGAVVYVLFRPSEQINQTMQENWKSTRLLIWMMGAFFTICIGGLIVLFQLDQIPPEPIGIFGFYFVSQLIPAILIILCAWQFRNQGIETPLPLQRKLIVGIGSGCLLFVLAAVLATLWPTQVNMSSELAQFTQSIPSLLIFFLFAILAAIVEEVIFRLGIQGILERHFTTETPLIAVAITSIIFALGHAGMTDQLGFKEIQIFITGMVFGILKVHYGLSASIFAHITLNAISVSIAIVALLFGAQ